MPGGVGSSLPCRAGRVRPLPGSGWGEGWASCPGCEVQAGAADSLSGTEPWASQMELSSVRFFQIRTGVVFLCRPILSALPLTSQALAPCRLPAPRPRPRGPALMVNCARVPQGSSWNARSWDTCPRPLCRDLYAIHAPLLPGPAQACLWGLH